MQKISLFDRIRDKNKDYQKSIRSVVLNLQKLLNSRQGTCLMDKEFGMVDFTDLAIMFPDSVRDIERYIAKIIQRYEPRLSDIKVSFDFQDDYNLSIGFHIQAMMRTDDKDSPIHLQSTIDSGGKTIIKG